MSNVRIITADVRYGLAQLEDESVQCVVTSPPYWGLRDYGVDGQIGREATPEAFTQELVGIFAEVRRVLRADGTLWLNLGDSYAQSSLDRTGGREGNRSTLGGGKETQRNANRCVGNHGCKPKDLVGIPWRVAFALQADGWYLRSDIIWHKPNPMPESVTDRPTKAHEYIFLMAKSERYRYDADAIAEPSIHAGQTVVLGDKSLSRGQARGAGVAPSGNGSASSVLVKDTRNARSVWTITTKSFKEAHFATFPEQLAERCIKAGCPEGGTVLDPFGGAGTTGLVAAKLGRDAVLVELNPEYAAMARRRIEDALPLMVTVVADKASTSAEQAERAGGA